MTTTRRLFLVLCSAPVSALASAGRARPAKPLAPLRVLIIGDSISAYASDVQQMLSPGFEVTRYENARWTTWLLENKLDAWLLAKRWDIIHWNNGLWDVLHHPTSNAIQTSAASYETNLRAIIWRMRATNPQARIIFATSTPVPSELAPGQPIRQNSDVVHYNAIARDVMMGEGVAINDLYSLALSRLGDWQNPKDVHFCSEGQRALAHQVAGAIRAQVVEACAP